MNKSELSFSQRDSCYDWCLLPRSGSYVFVLVTNRPTHHQQIKSRHVATYLSCVDCNLSLFSLKTIDLLTSATPCTWSSRRRSSLSSHKLFFNTTKTQVIHNDNHTSTGSTQIIEAKKTSTWELKKKFSDY